jgi:hypothetical protein
MPLSSVTRYPGGLTNVGVGDAFADFKDLDPFTYNVAFTDFNDYIAANWVVGSGGGTVALAAGVDGGAINIVSGAVANVEQDIQYGSGAAVLPFTPDLTKDLWFAARVRLDNVALAQMHLGLDIADADPILTVPANGIYIRKAAGAAPVAVLRIASVDVAVATLGAMSDNVWYEFVIAYTAANGVLNVFQNNAGFRLATNPAALPAVALGVNLSVSPSTAAARTMGVDYVFAAKQR